MLATVLVALAMIGIGSASAATKDDLVKDGYSCARVSVNFTECTKKDSKTQWCDDAGNCQAKPKRRPLDAKSPSAVEAVSQP